MSRLCWNELRWWYDYSPSQRSILSKLGRTDPLEGLGASAVTRGYTDLAEQAWL